VKSKVVAEYNDYLIVGEFLRNSDEFWGNFIRTGIGWFVALSWLIGLRAFLSQDQQQAA
jgi:hypothetical protein